MRRLVLLLVLPLFLALAGCSSLSTTSARDGGAAHDPYEPLFAADADVIDDLEIARMLETAIALPPQVRIGAHYLGHRRERGGRTVLLSRAADLPAIYPALAGLADSPRVADVAPLPALLVPHVRRPGNLRAAAARYQADLLLLYETRTVMREKSPLLGKHRKRAWCDAECTVLDVRTGLVAFTSRARVELTAEDPDRAWGSDEAAVLIEQDALEDAMARNAENLARYLATVAG